MDKNISNNPFKTKPRYRRGDNPQIINKNGESLYKINIARAYDKLQSKIIKSYNNKEDRIAEESKRIGANYTPNYILSNDYNEWNDDQKIYFTRVRRSKIDNQVRSTPVKFDKNYPISANITCARKVKGQNIYKFTEDTYEEFLLKRVPSFYRSIPLGRTSSTREMAVADSDESAGTTEEEWKYHCDCLAESFPDKIKPSLILVNIQYEINDNGEVIAEPSYHSQLIWFIDKPYVDPLWEVKNFPNYFSKKYPNEGYINEDKITYNALTKAISKHLGADSCFTGCWCKNPFAEGIYAVRYREENDLVSREALEEFFAKGIKEYKLEKGYIDNDSDDSDEVDENASIEKEPTKPSVNISSEIFEKVNSIKNEDTLDSIIKYFIQKKLPDSFNKANAISRYMLVFNSAPGIIWNYVKKEEDITQSLVDHVIDEIAFKAGNISGKGFLDSDEIQHLKDTIYPFVKDNFNPSKKKEYVSKWSDEDRMNSILSKKENANIQALKLACISKINGWTSSDKNKVLNNKEYLKELGLSRNTVKSYFEKNHYPLYIQAKNTLAKEKKKLEKMWTNLSRKYKKLYKPSYIEDQEELIKMYEDIIALYEYLFFNKKTEKIDEIINRVIDITLSNIKDEYTRYFYTEKKISGTKSLFSPNLQYCLYRLIKPDILKVA